MFRFREWPSVTKITSKFEGFSALLVVLVVMFSFTTVTSRFEGFKTLRAALTRIIKNKSTQPLKPTGFYKTPAPRVIHSNLNIDKDSKIIIVGDVHGCLDELKLLLIKCEFQKNIDKLVFVGDLVNKGPYSAEVVKFVRNIGASCVRGNHDDAALAQIMKKMKEGEDYKPHYHYCSDLNSEEIEWLTELPYTLSIPSHNAIVVHAGFVPGTPLEEQKLSDMYILRTVPSASSDDSDDKEVPWAALWKKNDGPHVYFGHDAKRGLQLCDYATGLDTGCCYGKKLTAVILPRREIVQVDALKVYEKVKG